MLLQTKHADLYYERMGSGPTMLIVHGAVEDTSYFSELAHYLRDFFDVITYDRRGNSESRPKEGASFDHAGQTEDAVSLIRELDLHDVILFGHSAGGQVCFETFKALPGRIRHVIAYETPLLELLPDRDERVGWVERVETLNAQHRNRETSKEFAVSIGEQDERARKKTPDEKIKDRQNFGHFINYEFHDFSYYQPDIAFLKTNARYITLLQGDRNHGHYFHVSMQVLSEKIGCRLFYTAGCHNAPYDIPESFAISLIGVCRYLRLL